MRTWQRAFRRAGVPLAYSQGFNPHPKMSFGSALAVGVTSSGEYLDVELKKRVDLENLKENIKQNLPLALKFIQVKEIDKESPALMSIINRARYIVKVKIVKAISDIVFEQFLQQESILVMKRTKRGLKEKDIKSGIYNLEVRMLEKDILQIFLEVETGSKGNIRPEDVINALQSFTSSDWEIMDIHREGLYICEEDRFSSPLDV